MHSRIASRHHASGFRVAAWHLAVIRWWARLDMNAEAHGFLRHAGSFNQRPLQTECTATWHVVVGTCLEMNPQPHLGVTLVVCLIKQ